MLQRSSTPSSSGVTARGTVDFVYSGSRVKVLLPSEGCVLQVTLSQVRVHTNVQSVVHSAPLYSVLFCSILMCSALLCSILVSLICSVLFSITSNDDPPI